MNTVAEKKMGVASLAVNSLALLFNIIALAIPNWTSHPTEPWSYMSFGLWKQCQASQTTSRCAKIPSVPGYLSATRAMMILGMLLIMTAAACGGLKLFMMKEQERFPKLAGATAIVSGTFMFIGAIVYAAESSGGTTVSLDAGFGLAIVSALLAVLAGVGYFVAENKKQI